MAEITLIHDGTPNLVPMEGRSAGVHVSHVINYVCVRLGHYKESDDPDQVRWELGSSLEWAIIARQQHDEPDRFIQPGELELDGMYGTPDLLDLYDEAVEEIKLTWKVATYDINSKGCTRYLWQLKAYCKMMGWRKGRLHICFVDGDGKGWKKRSVYRVWELVFTQEELDQNWNMIRKHAALMLAEQAHKNDDDNAVEGS